MTLPSSQKSWVKHSVCATIQSVCSCFIRWPGLVLCRAKLQKTTSCSDRSWQNSTSHFSWLYVLYISLHTSDLLPEPRLKYPMAYLTFPIGSQSTWHLKLNVSNVKLMMFLPHPTCSSSSLSHLSNGTQMLRPKNEKKKRSRCYSQFLSFPLPHMW